MGFMAVQLALKTNDFRSSAISPLKEMGAYEALWLRKGTSFKSLAEMFRKNLAAIPSDFVSEVEASECANRVLAVMSDAGVRDFGVRVHGAGEYPSKLRDAKYPIELLYYRGWWDLVETPAVAIVGTRKPSREGIARAKRLAKSFVKDGYTVVSGLAKGIDTAAHTAAIDAGGRTIAVLGTPLTSVYPRENVDLQRQIGDDFLLVSQVPVLRHRQAKDPRVNRHFFPERNVTMSALTLGSVIVEAGETSGTLYQARAALDQGRKLFVLDNCFQRGLNWPEKLLKQGAIRVADFEDIRANLNAA